MVKQQYMTKDVKLDYSTKDTVKGKYQSEYDYEFFLKLSQLGHYDEGDEDGTDNKKS